MSEQSDVRALVIVIESMRRIERHASTELMEQAFSGFAALPPATAGSSHWTEVFGVGDEWNGRPADQVLEHVKSRYRALVKANAKAFMSGATADNTEIVSKVNVARDAAIAELEPIGVDPWRRR
jgi:hypothetical protein